MVLTRRSFLKSLAAIAGVTAVPALGISLQSVPEPVSWVIEEFEYGSELAVAAQWFKSPDMIRHAVIIPMPSAEFKDKAILHCKQALRQWYYERHILKIPKAA